MSDPDLMYLTREVLDTLEGLTLEQAKKVLRAVISAMAALAGEELEGWKE